MTRSAKIGILCAKPLGHYGILTNGARSANIVPTSRSSFSFGMQVCDVACGSKLKERVMQGFHTVVVPRVTNDGIVSNTGNPYVAEFARKIDLSRKQKGKVYQTYVDGEKGVDGEERERFAFVTTSKDIHLRIGLLNSLGQYLLAKLLEYEFQNKSFGQLMLCLQKDLGDDDSNVLVAITRDTALGETSFGLSPAH